MIINAMTTAHRNEYFRKLREHQRLTLESVTEQRNEIRADLEFRRGLFQLQEQQMDSLREQRDRLAEALWSMLNQDDMSAIRAGILLRSLGLQSPTNPNKL